MKVLLIDDSKTMRSIQKSILTQLGLTEIEEACDGVDALKKAEEFCPDLLLVDWSMPNMDGITFVKQYRARGSMQPIIMVSTEAEKSRMIEAIKAGVNSYVVKPFTPDILSQRIEEFIGQATKAA